MELGPAGTYRSQKEVRWELLQDGEPLGKAPPTLWILYLILALEALTITNALELPYRKTGIFTVAQQSSGTF